MERILIYCLVSLGDVVMATSVIPILKARWPEAKIGMLVKGANAAVVEDNPNIDIPLTLTYKSRSINFLPMWRIIRQLRRQKFDMSMSLDRHRRGARINWLAGIPERVGPAHIYEYSKSSAPKYYTTVIEPNLDVIHDGRIRAMQDMARQYAGNEVEGRPSFGRLSEANHLLAQKLLATLPPSQYRVGICLQSNLPIRSWPPERAAALIDHLWEKENTATYIIGTAKQKEYAEMVIAQARHRAANFCGLTGLKDLGALMMASDGFVGVDTGSSHMVVALGASLVVLMGSSTPKQYRPVSCSVEAEAWNRHLWSGRSCSPCDCWTPADCPHNMACMYDISVADVSAKLLELRQNRMVR